MITVIIPTRNRAELLAGALDSLTRQTLPGDGFEVLVVDNGSTDHTAAVADRFVTRLGNLRYLYQPEPGLHAGRHKGMQEARGEVLVFADDDIEALPTWLASVREGFAEADVALLGGNNLPLFTEPPPAWLERLWRRPAPIGGRALPALSLLELPGAKRALDPFYVWGCNFSVRKDVLLASGGFCPDGMPKDLVRFRGDGETHVARYVASSGMRCLFHPGASVRHKVTPERMTFAHFREQGFKHGVSDSYTVLRGQARWSWLRLMVARARRKLADVADSDEEVRHALRELGTGYDEGYAYHQRMYREHTEIRDWVHKPRYF